MQDNSSDLQYNILITEVYDINSDLLTYILLVDVKDHNLQDKIIATDVQDNTLSNGMQYNH